MRIVFDTLPKAFAHLFDKVENIERLLQTRTELTPEADEPLTIQQAAAFIKLSVPTLYGLVSRAAIPVNKNGKRLYFSKQELTDWIKACRKRTGVMSKAIFTRGDKSGKHFLKVAPSKASKRRFSILSFPQPKQLFKFAL